MADSGLIRKRLRAEIEAARRHRAARRERTAAAERAYESFLEAIAVPAFRTLANILRAESLLFDVQTPSGGVSLVSDRHRDEAIALELDRTVDPPQPSLAITHTRGSRSLRTERPLKEGAAIEEITEDDVIERLIEELRPWLA